MDVAANLLNFLKMVSVTHFLMPPGIFPETSVGDGVASSEANLSVNKDAKRPPAKRVNHGVLAVSGPFAADWSLLRTLGKC